MINPRDYPEEAFALYSIPAYDTRKPTVTLGCEIGSTKKLVREGDVLLSKIIPHVRRSWIVQPSEGRRQIASSEWIVFHTRNFHAPYLRHVLLSNQFHARFMRTVSGVGGSLVRARPAAVAQIDIPAPPIVEQRRIAGILDQTDELRAKRRRTAASLDKLITSVFLDMFAGEDSRSWPLTTVADVAAAHKGAIRTGPFGSQLLHSEFVDDGIAVLGIDNVVANEFRWEARRYITEAKYQTLKRYTVKPGDVLITIMGTCGRCAIVPDDIPTAINTKHLCCITVDRTRCLPEYLHAYFLFHPLARSYLHKTAKGAIMSGLNMEIIKALPLLLPPVSQQHEFRQRRQQVEDAKTASREHAAQLDALFESLQERAFAGWL